MDRRSPRGALFPYTTLFRSLQGPSAITLGPDGRLYVASEKTHSVLRYDGATGAFVAQHAVRFLARQDRKSTRLNSSHVEISYAVFCLKKKNNTDNSLSNCLA